jgi:hypothetical protein
MCNVYSCNRDGFFLGVVRDPAAIVADFGRPMSLADSLTRAGHLRYVLQALRLPTSLVRMRGAHIENSYEFVGGG